MAIAKLVSSVEHDIFAQLPGNWKGSQSTFLKPDELLTVDRTLAEIRYRLDRKLLEIDYSHLMSEIEYTGLLLITISDKIEAVWFDTYHTQSRPMNFQGYEDKDLVLIGEYDVGDETWGWEIHLVLSDEDSKLDIIHYNIPPNSHKYIGVHAKYEFAGDDFDDDVY